MTRFVAVLVAASILLACSEPDPNFENLNPKPGEMVERVDGMPTDKPGDLLGSTDVCLRVKWKYEDWINHQTDTLYVADLILVWTASQKMPSTPDNDRLAGVIDDMLYAAIMDDWTLWVDRTRLLISLCGFSFDDDFDWPGL